MLPPKTDREGWRRVEEQLCSLINTCNVDDNGPTLPNSMDLAVKRLYEAHLMNTMLTLAQHVCVGMLEEDHCDRVAV